MALKIISLLSASLLTLTTLPALSGRTGTMPEIPADPKSDENKQPEWFVDPDGSALIPGIGRVMVPSLGHTPSTPSSGSDNGIAETGNHIPGADDTVLPNPAFEVPSPAGVVVPILNPPVYALNSRL